MKQSLKQKQIPKVQQGIDLSINSIQQMPQAKNIQLQHTQCAELRDKLDSRNQMLDASVDCIKLLSLDGHVLHMNRAGCLALGVSPTETEFGMSWHTLLPEEVRDACLNAFAEAKQGKTSRFVGMSQVANEPVAYWDNMLSPVFNEYGQVKEILCVTATG